MSTLVDTDVLIDLLRGCEAARTSVAKALREGALVASVVSRAELLSGMRAAETEATAELLGILRWVPVDTRVADRAGALARRHRAAHPGVGLPDYLIGATADLFGLRLLTRNVRHFPMLPRLRPAY